MKTLILFTLLSLAPSLHANVTLAFFETFDYYGNKIVLEDNGRFTHVALSNGDFWIHAHPAKGEVEAEQTIEDMNFFKVKVTIINNPNFHISTDRLQEYIGAPYDRLFEWRGHSFYNSEFVGHLLSLEPSTMDFSAPYWNQYPFSLPQNAQGLSPDDVYQQAIDMGFE